MKRFSQNASHHYSLAELNITPLLDLAFVLLIIFIITTPMIEQGINVSTPSSSPNQMAVDPASVKTVSLDRDGRIFLEKEPVTTETLEKKLASMIESNPKLAVGIRADKSLPYEKVVAVIDALQKAGVTQFGLITKVDN